MSNATWSKFVQILCTNSKVLVKVTKKQLSLGRSHMEKVQGRESKGTSHRNTSESTSKNMFPESEGLTVIFLTRKKFNLIYFVMEQDTKAAKVSPQREQERRPAKEAHRGGEKGHNFQGTQ